MVYPSLRDWLFSRQRYWGEPFPIVWEEGRHRAIPESELPLLPPSLEDFKPTGTGEPPLAKATEWQAHSVRGFLSGTIGKKMGTPVESSKRADGERAYRISSK